MPRETPPATSWFESRYRYFYRLFLRAADHASPISLNTFLKRCSGWSISLLRCRLLLATLAIEPLPELSGCSKSVQLVAIVKFPDSFPPLRVHSWSWVSSLLLITRIYRRVGNNNYVVEIVGVPSWTIASGLELFDYFPEMGYLD